MKKRFLPFSLLLVIMILGQSITIADNGGHYVPRKQATANAESFMASLRANQHTGLIDPALMIQAMQDAETRATADNELYWLSMGPDNMGGQTTAVLYDNKKNASGNWSGVVYIGSKGGGVYKTYNKGITWHHVGNKNLMVSCMAQDANGNIYVGTGDGGSAVSHNGMDELGYANSFVGSGIYVLDANDVFTPIASTVPSANEATEWSFVNEIVCTNSQLIVATDSGLKYSTDNGNTWNEALPGRADEVKAQGNTIVASVEGKIYIGSTPDALTCHSANGNSMQGDSLIPKAAGLLDIAIAPTNENVIYAGCIAADGKHAGFYVSSDKGATWSVVLPATDAHNVYSSNGLYNHGIVVSPSNEGILYVLGVSLWKLEKTPSGTGFYMVEQMTGQSMFFMPNYLHIGLHAMAFNPANANECYIGTDGGIYKGMLSNAGFTFSNCNRDYKTTRMYNVALSGLDKRILAAGMDHGVVLIDGTNNVNTEGYGNWINPNGSNMGMFDESSQAGSCAISSINSNTIFVTYKGGNISRSETMGDDWVSTNFTSHASISLASNYRTPILLHENFNDPLNQATVWFKNTTDANMPSGTTIQLMSNLKFPFDYTLTAPLNVGDSIEIHDPISSRLYVATTNVVYVSKQALSFGLETVWYKLTQSNTDTLGYTGGFTGTPLCMVASADGENLFVGTKEGQLFRFMGDNAASTDSIWYTYNASGAVTSTNYSHFVAIDPMQLPIEGQCVTSVAVDPRDANKVVVTLGNYGNDTYVLYSTNALSSNPTFTSMQGNLPKMPVYSSVIEMATGKVIIGTERGIYTASSVGNTTWIADGNPMGEVPVLELKQQLLSQGDAFEVIMSEEDTVVNFFQGVHNTGIIYAATYGKGVYRCENYKQQSGTSVPEMPIVTETKVEMYPNPAREQAVVSFEMKSDANVSYQVYDMMGRLVMSQGLGRLSEGKQQINLNTSELSAGSYILRLNQGTSNATVKFLVY